MGKMKPCTKCHEVKPLEEFYLHRVKGRLERRASACKSCTALQQKEYRERNRNAYARYAREWQRRKLYGVSPEVFERMVESADRKCLGCEREVPLQLDHDHRTGLIRGLLCGSCNRALGLLQDDPATLRRLLTYLKYHEWWCQAEGEVG